MKTHLTGENRLEYFACKALCILCGVVFLWLLIQCFFYTGTDSIAGIFDEKITIGNDSAVRNAVWLLVFFIAVLILSRVVPANLHFNMDWAAAAVCLVGLCISFYWVYVTKTTPCADQETICAYAYLFNNGDFSGLARGNYVGVYSQQLGLITILRCIFHLGGSHKAFQFINAFFVPVIICTGYLIVKRLFPKKEIAQLLYLLFCLLCIPLYVYTAYVYGEIMSIAFCLLGIWMLLLCIERMTLARCILLSLFSGLAIVVRANSLIVIVAFCVVLLVKTISNFSWRWPALAAVILCGVLAFNVGIKALYADVTPDDSASMPSLAWIAMGTHTDSSLGIGCYDGSNYDLFRSCNWDKAATSKAALADIKNFFKKGREDPEAISSFYCEKITTQWNVPMYQCFVMNRQFSSDVPSYIASLYLGKYKAMCENFMNIYQTLIFAGFILYVSVEWKKWRSIEQYLLPLIVFGGFLFSILWEAKARYVFPYFVLMIPCAAIGYTAAAQTSIQFFKRLKQKRAEKT